MRKLIVAVLFVLAAVLSWQAVTGNRDRRELEAIEQRLDFELYRKRPVAQDLESWREQQAAVEKELAELRHRTTPDLARLADLLKAQGGTLHPGSAPQSERYFNVTGSSTLSRVLAEIERSGHEIDAIRIEVRDEGWTADFVAHLYVETATETAVAPEREEPWYGFINASLRKRIADKQRELEELDRKLGPLTRYWAMEQELDARKRLIEELGQRRIDLVHLATVLFIDEPRAFATGSLERSRASLRGGLIGRLARPIEDPDLIALFGSEVSARIVRRYADTVELAFQKK